MKQTKSEWLQDCVYSFGLCAEISYDKRKGWFYVDKYGEDDEDLPVNWIFLGKNIGEAICKLHRLSKEFHENGSAIIDTYEGFDVRFTVSRQDLKNLKLSYDLSHEQMLEISTSMSKILNNNKTSLKSLLKQCVFELISE